MILKLGMKHQAMELYKFCINHDPGKTLTFFTARCVRAFTLSILNISETSWPIAVIFYRKQHWGGGLPAIGF